MNINTITDLSNINLYEDKSNFIIKHNNLIKKISESKNTHPNLTNFWIKLLNFKKKSYENCFNIINNNINNLTLMEDFTKEQLILITYLNNFK